jgi:hypothetical protein
MARDVRAEALVLSDALMDLGVHVEPHDRWNALVVSEDDRRIGAYQVTEDGVFVLWESEAGELFDLLDKAHAPRVRPRLGAGGTITPDTAVYASAAWWEDSDPFLRVVALSSKRVGNLITEAVREEARSADLEEGEDIPIYDSGVSTESLGALASYDELEEAAEALIQDGVWYPESP